MVPVEAGRDDLRLRRMRQEVARNLLDGEPGTLLEGLNKRGNILRVAAVVELGPAEHKVGLDIGDHGLGLQRPNELVLASGTGHALYRQDATLASGSDLFVTD